MKTIKILVIFALVVAILIAIAAINKGPQKSPNEAGPVLTPEAVKSIVQDIDNRVSWVKDQINNQWYDNHYDGDIVIYRYFEQDMYEDSFTTYDAYYDENGKLIYVNIVHYRSIMYFIYFHNDELLHVTVGSDYPFEGSVIDGDISDLQTIITEAPIYAFILEDLAFCLSHAYSADSSSENSDSTEDVVKEPFVPTEQVNPYGVWEITDSIQSNDNYAPDMEAWPDALENGRVMLITENTFGIEAYPNEETFILHFWSLDYVSADYNYIERFRMRPDAQEYFFEHALDPAVWVEIYADESSAEISSPYRQICFIDYDTILYTDGMYLYKLVRSTG